MTARQIKFIWDQVQVDPALREFISLSPTMVANLTQAALRMPNPSAHLTETLNEIGRLKRDAIRQHRQKRRAEDRAFLANSSRWSGAHCCVKEQPWIKANGRRFGRVFKDDFERGNWTVYVEGEASETFPSLRALVEVWSVD